MSASALPHWTNYLDAVSVDGLDERLSKHLDQASAILSGIPADRVDYAYAPGKWTVRQLMGHILMSHRIFITRAVCSARGEEKSFPGYDENAYAENWPHQSIGVKELASAYADESRATRNWIRWMTPEERAREGVANNLIVRPEYMIRALIGHEQHHLNVLRERYGVGL